jgi:SPFH domain / Band 7 family
MDDFKMSLPMEELSGKFRTRARYWRPRLVSAAIIALVMLIGLLATWRSFFVYVPPGSHLIIISKDGKPLAPGQILAEEGEKGIQRAVEGEGWHFVLPIVYSTELEKNVDVPAGKVGIVTARGGKPLPEGRLLAEDGEQGIQRRVLPPGTYRINGYGFDVELVPAIDIKPGYVGVQRRLLGQDSQGRFAESDQEKGILRTVLQPGMYYINTKEFEIIPTEIGIFQTTFISDPNPKKSTAITFTSKGGFAISMDCTVEWEVLPQDMPSLIAEYGGRKAVETNVIEVQAHAIGRDKGIDYGAQDFLEGTRREKFQDDFTKELTRICREKAVTVHAAFIRNIAIPDEYLTPIRDKQVAAETEITNQVKEATAESVADVEREQQMIVQRGIEVEAETKRLVAGIDRETSNTATRNEAQIGLLKAEYGAKIAALIGQKTETMGAAEANVTQLVETARSSLYQMKMDVFQNDGDAFLRYTLAEGLNPKMIVRLFQSGPGTFWTNMEGRNLNMLLPTGAFTPPSLPTAPPLPSSPVEKPPQKLAK